jgi:hypothetical protein
MSRSVALVGFLALQAGVFLVGPALLRADDPPPFLKVMEDNFSGKKNVHKAIKKAIDADSTDWGEVDKLMKKYAAAARNVGAHAKDKPEKGDDKSWAKLTVQFAGQAKELEAAVAAKDKEKAKATLEKLNDTCETCHEAHR